MKITFFIMLITVFLYSGETANKDLIIKYCKDKASVFKDYKRLYNHEYNNCYKKAKNYTSEQLKKNNQKLEISNLEKSEKVIGIWFVNWGFKYKQTFFYRGNILFSKTLYSDGSGSTKKMKYKKIRNGIIKVLDIDPYGAYYLIRPDKKLEFWSLRGKFYTAEKLEKIHNIALTEKNYLAVGKKVPFNKWDKYGQPETLKGTNNKFWIVYLPKIDTTFKSKKTSDIVLSVKKRTSSKFIMRLSSLDFSIKGSGFEF